MGNQKQKRIDGSAYVLLIDVFVVLVFLIVFLSYGAKALNKEENISPLPNKIADTKASVATPLPTPTTTPLPKTEKQTEEKLVYPKPGKTIPQEWGIAKQIGEHTWTMKVGEDPKMTTVDELFEALNQYRQMHGRGRLEKDDRLMAYAQSRADGFSRAGTTDAHAGFNDFLKNQDGFNKLGFYAVGENSSIGFKLFGVHLTEWVFAGDEPHNNNQLDPSWTHAGVGVSGTATNLIFARSKI